MKLDYHSITFDIDGLLIDSEPIFQVAARGMLGSRGKELTPELAQRMMGSPSRQVYALFREMFGFRETLEELIQEGWERFFHLWDQSPAPFLPGALALLDQLEAAGIPKALATSSSRRYVERIFPAELIARFSFVLTCDDISVGKPHPEIYLKAANRWEHEPSKMLVFEDSVNGLKSAKGAGAICLSVPHGLVDRSLLSQADAILDTLNDPRLPRLLGLGNPSTSVTS
jgi:HAD superfamily hydrolase (TIGR01509 family)